MREKTVFKLILQFVKVVQNLCLLRFCCFPFGKYGAVSCSSASH